ncbi:MAG: murein biosynthesis integral membrane protein MurJ [Acidimicrobiales bacterium]
MLVRTNSTVVGDSATSAVWTLISRVTGFGRVLLIGAVLGPSYFGNLFQLANQMPWIVFDLAIGALLGALLVPELVRHIASGDRQRTERIAGGFLGLVLSAFTAIALLVMLFSTQIASLFAITIDDPATKELFIETARPLLWLTAPQLVGYGIAMTGQAVQHATGHYLVPAAASILENVTVIITLIVFAVVFGTGVGLGELQGGEVLLLGLGSSLGVALHALAQIVGARRVGLSIRPRWGWSDPDVRSVLRNALPTSATALLNGMRLLIMLIASNTVAGGVVAFQLALNVLNLPVALGSKPVAYALLPRLARHFQAGEMEEFSDGYRRGVGLAALLNVPAAAAALAIGWFAAGAVAVGEMDTAEGRELLSLVLVGIAGAIIGEGLQQLAVAASYAKGDPRGPLNSVALRVLLTFFGTMLSLSLLSGAETVLGIAVSMSVADLVASGYLHRRLSATFTPGSYGLSASVLRTTGASVVSFGIGGFVAAVVAASGSFDAPAQRAGATLAIVGVALIAFVTVRVQLDDEVPSLLEQLRPGRDSR